MRRNLLTVLLLAAALLGGCAAPAETPPEPVPTEAADMALTVTLDGQEYTGLYTGTVFSGLPDGYGSFTAADGPVFTGLFAGGKAMEGQAEALPAAVTLSGLSYGGLYTGPVTDGRPEGTGSFTGVSAAGFSLSYSGGWSAGGPAGDGELTADFYALDRRGEECIGSYSGQTRDGLPHGEGSFHGTDRLGAFGYTGQWEAGLFHGQGRLEYEGENYYLRQGTFAEGLFSPTYPEALDVLGGYDPQFTLTEAQREFISQFPALWDDSTDRRNFNKSDYQKLIERNYYQQLYFKSPEDYETSWVRLPSLRLIDWNTVTFENGFTVNCFTAANDGYTLTYRCYLVGEVTETLRARGRVDMYAMPVALSQYTNTLGEDVTCAVVLVGDIRIR